MEYHVYWLLKSFCFEIFGNGKYGLFLNQKLMEIWCLLITEKFLFWPFQRWEIPSFLSQKIVWKMIFTDYWKVLLSTLLVMGNTVFFFSQKIDGKMIFIWSFWAFHDIPGLGKYGFSCSVKTSNIWQIYLKINKIE